ncbi:MAG: UDP-glucose 4-epimerase [Planctomycetota bacterium]|nr:UDP-glucose 4-epimerase [Planctomycetota bacterium]
MRVIITRAAGFIVSDLVDRVLANWHEVLAVVNFDPDSPEAVKRANLAGHPRFHLDTRDIREASGVDRLVADDRPDAPFRETDRVDLPINPHSATRTAYEFLAHTFPHLDRLPVTGLMIAALGKEPRIDYRPEQPGDVRQTFADVGRARTELGYQPATPLAVGLARHVKWRRRRRMEAA